MTRRRRLHEMLTVEIGAIGVSAKGIGIVPVTIDLDGMNEQEIGKAMADGFRDAHRQAVLEFGPAISAAWAADPERITNGDDEGEEADTPD